MYQYAIVFLIASLFLALFGFFDLAGNFSQVAQALAVIFIFMALISYIVHTSRN